MKKINVLKYGVFLVVSLTLMGAAPGCQKMVNFYNNLVSGGGDFTARLVCSSGTWKSSTGQLSPCKPVVSSQVCNCKFYADGEFIGNFSGCADIGNCSGDATLILKMSGNEPGLFLKCVTTCGDSVSEVSESIELEEILDFTFMLEEGEEVFELFEDE